MFNSIFLQINLTNQRISMFKLLFYINPFISFLFHTASSDCCIFSSWSYYLHLCVFDRFSNIFFLFQIKVWFSSWLIIFLTPMGKIIMEMSGHWCTLFSRFLLMSFQLNFPASQFSSNSHSNSKPILWFRFLEITFILSIEYQSVLRYWMQQLTGVILSNWKFHNIISLYSSNLLPQSGSFSSLPKQATVIIF